MKNQDNLYKLMKELPKEEPSANFSVLVMDRVRAESVIVPAVYQPLISRDVWWRFLLGAVLFFVAAALLRYYFPENDPSLMLQSLSKIDFSPVLKPFASLSNAMNNLSLSFVSGLLAVAILLFADRLYSRFTEH